MIRDKIRKARIASGYTQEEFAVILGVDRSSYAYYETGKSDIPVKTLLAAAAIFNIAFEWFITPDEDVATKKKKLEAPSTKLASPNIFIPETLPGYNEEYDDEEDEDEDAAYYSGAAALSSEERIALARYRIIKESGRGDELDGIMKKIVEEEMDKL